MKYMLLTYADRDFKVERFAAENPDFVPRMVAFMRELNEELAASGELAAAEGLADPDQTRTVRPGAAGPVVTDGPFAEAKEVFVGFWVVDVANFDRAAEIASRIVSFVDAPIEIRPIGEAPA
jgi:hypothetical protein